ncbi:MAG: undecaprenyl-diphosphate phosphatase [Fuerstiella sp.]
MRKWNSWKIMMEYVHAVILGVVQGIAEFLPISSSGHLVISDALLRQLNGGEMPEARATMNIALHFGTLVSILIVYFDSLWKLRSDFRTQALVIVATIPVGIIGLLLKGFVDEHFQSPMVAGCALLVTAGFLWVGQKLQASEQATEKLTFGGALAVGIFQAVAIVPGISRSGSTIAAGLACGLKREAAARFSFLIAIPAIGGASVLELKDLVTGEKPFTGDAGALILGMIVSCLVGLVALKWLLRIVAKDKLHWFAIYCVVVGCATIAWQLISPAS